MIKTIVELDLKGYSDVARELEEHFSAELVLRFNEQIQTFVAGALAVAGVGSSDALMATTGDGAILVFDSPSIAHVFAEAVHRATNVYNHEKTISAAKRWFRIGIATGDLAIDEIGGLRKMAGSVIARAVRLEAAAAVGEIIADVATYTRLPHDQRACYTAEQIIAGKRNESFRARRYPVVSEIAGAAPAQLNTELCLAPTDSLSQREPATLVGEAVLRYIVLIKNRLLHQPGKRDSIASLATVLTSRLIDAKHATQIIRQLILEGYLREASGNRYELTLRSHACLSRSPTKPNEKKNL
jgi:class 3 adenylate cyclase